MPITDAKKRKIGRELVDWIYLGIRVGARNSVAVYRAEKLKGHQSEAISHITRAANMPRRARLRINEWINSHEQQNGNGSGMPFLIECLSLAGSVTYGEINSELISLEIQVNQIIDDNVAGGTLDEMATSLEGALEDESLRWQFPFPTGYLDIQVMDN